MGPWDKASFNYPAQYRNSFQNKSIAHQAHLFICDNISRKEIMSWQMPGGITIKDLSLVIISAIGDEDEETPSFIFNANSILKSRLV